LDRISVAVSDKDGNVLASQTHENHFDACAILALMIAKILKNVSATMKDVSVCITTVGPGSFTGIRTGLSTAYGIAAANPNIRICGITSFEALLASYNEQNALPAKDIVIAIDTKRNDYYFLDVSKTLSPQIGVADQIICLAKGLGVGTVITNKPDGFSYSERIDIIEQKIRAEALFKAADLENLANQPLRPFYLKDAGVTVK
jgi:tRNA threonylcarbamoyladenosine biosynthesis protein TsaB